MNKTKNSVKVLVMDVDGTLTDGRIYLGNQGEVMKAFSVKDGYAIGTLLPQHGIVPIVITGRESEIVKRRCEELGITEVYQNCKNKQEKLLEVAKKHKLPIKDGIIEGCAFIGDDIPDISCINISEINGCPADAAYAVKKSVSYICKKAGGEGAVREFIEWIICD